MNEDIEDAEWQDVPGNGGSLHVKVASPADGPDTRTPLQEAEGSAWLSGEFWRDTLRAGCFGLAAIVGLVMVASFFTPERQAQLDRDEDAFHDASMLAVPEPDNQPTAPPPVDAGIIDSCYHLDSCDAYKIISTDVVTRVGKERLVKAVVVRGEVQDAQGDASDFQRMQWSSEKEEFFALCSRKRPTIAFASDGSWIAQEFDFVTGIPGVQQDDANIYQALCHGFFDNELESRAKALGYVPLPNGGRGQFTIQDPHELISP